MAALRAVLAGAREYRRVLIDGSGEAVTVRALDDRPEKGAPMTDQQPATDGPTGERR